MKLFNYSPIEGSVRIQDNWTPARRLLFRFSFIFFALFFLVSFIIAHVPWIGAPISRYNDQFWTAIVGWITKTFLNLPELSSEFTGSGDGTLSWVTIALYVVLALIGTTVWSVLDRKRNNYPKLWRWTYLAISYSLAYVLFAYGVGKTFGGQFPAPGISRLMETFGESSPMRIMWTFMGASGTYVRFSGWSETIAAILLIFPRTRTLGGLVAVGVMLNVFMMNMSYDVPVKLYSFIYMMTGLYIALADHKRLLRVFLINKPVHALNWAPLFKTTWKNYVLLGIQVLFIGQIVVTMFLGGLDVGPTYGPNRPRSVLYGIHDVDNFILNGDTLPPLLSDSVRWRKAFVDLPGFSGQLSFGIKMMNDNLRYLRAEIDSAEQVLTLRPFRDTVNVYHLNYTFEGKNLSLEGLFEGDTLQVNTVYFNPDDFILRSRGFNWINEVPYNRRVPYRN